ncbi:hypothetical protein HHK36_028493 [Tetracentron sinense]|uniref:RING-type E3 ubiquitin transferase n=1 Tax=Tetracentron sinense TaxID=13715 RepID=A0A834YFH7_TETSI|nr:hypothetical protein HHK36_028493 [Tetracentron sinense]
MGSLGNPKTWVPYENNKDCSQGFCSLYCPQWCYIIFPPPPPFGFPDDNSGPNFSPLVIAIIGILASAFLLVSYYTVISKYCGNLDSSRRRENHDPGEELDENSNPLHHEQWQVPTAGLDEVLIKSIAVCKYKKGDGLVEGTDCSVCLSEFQEDESLRLLPKCSHAFHLPCIDTWLKSHSNCPLCRANIISTNLSPLHLLPSVPENPPPDNTSSPERQLENDTVVAVLEDLERVGSGEEVSDSAVSKIPSRDLRDFGDPDERDTIIEIRNGGFQQIRRSVSMDFSCQGRISIADILRINDDDDYEMDNPGFQTVVGSSKRHGEEHSKSNNRSRVMHCVMSPVAMKRSYSSGRFLFTGHERGRNVVIPM